MYPYYPQTIPQNYLQNYPQSMQQNFQQNNPPLPQQQIIQVNGKASVDTIRLAPNSSILALDTTEPVVWMCVSDGVGAVTSKKYDIKEHEEKTVPGVEERIKALELSLAELEEKINVKQSNTTKLKSKQNITDGITD